MGCGERSRGHRRGLLTDCVFPPKAEVVPLGPRRKQRVGLRLWALWGPEFQALRHDLKQSV